MTFVLPTDAERSLLGEFLAESRESLQSSETAMLQLESDPDDPEALNAVFRAFHTIKGTAAFLGLEQIATLAHHAESLLSALRDGAIRCTSERSELLFLSIDVLLEALAAVERAADGGAPVLTGGFDELVEALQAAGPHVAMATPRINCAVDHLPIATTTNGRSGLRRLAAVDALVRVRTERLDQLVELAGELAVATAMISQDPIVRDDAHRALAAKVDRAEKIVRAVQEIGLAMRMVPLTAAFYKVARAVRDLSQRSGKPIQLDARGERTEIDRNLADALSDPLLHLVRNAIDHGIESPDERERRGKPRSGTITLSAIQTGGSVIVELRDDGSGLDRAKIARRAAERGLIDAARPLSESEIDALIFLPGFSTTDAVTDVSGRGVGLDVVRQKIEEMRGRVEIASTPGHGACFTIRLPLTLAVNDAMVVRVGAERYLVPTEAIRVSVRPESSQLTTIGRHGEALLVRGDIVPIVRLHRMFRVADAVSDPRFGLLVVVGTGRDAAALLVDEMLGQSQVVVRSLGESVGPVDGIAGGAILGDGRIGLILDVDALLEVARRDAGRDREQRRDVA